MRHTRRSFVETACVFLGVRVGNGSHRARRRRVKIRAFAQRLS
jgi:hypothetical protein